MSRRTLVALFIGLALIAGAVVTLSLIRTPPKRADAAAKAETPMPRPVAKEAPRADARAPVAPEASRRRTAPKSNSAPPTAAPVEELVDLGSLRIESDVAGAQVFIDREYIGTTPVTARKVAPGTHRLNVSAAGYEGFGDIIEVAQGSRDILIKFKEVRLDSKIDVVHKHRLGSCKGRLVATPQGLRYETSDKNDAFNSALLDLETFQVDYLEKKLSVKTRQGKRYDFSDPEGNADRLFVFQRDVEKARERLKNGDSPARR